MKQEPEETLEIVSRADASAAAFEYAAKPFALLGRKCGDYLLLIKFRLTLTVVFSSVMAFLIAAPQGGGDGLFIPLFVLALGGFLVTGAANALNQVLEKDYDRLMRRTANRPLAADRMRVSEAVMAAGLMSLCGVSLLAFFNPWAAFFGMVALLSYAFLYTPLKRITPLAVLVGAVPGALPALIGVAAAQGSVTSLALTLFALQFFWQFPHFWSIGWLSFDDYQRAGYRLMPSVNGACDPSVGRQAFLYALFLLPAAIAPWLLGVVGPFSMAIGLALSLAYAGLAWRFHRENNRRAALRLMFFSFVYLPLILVIYFIDKM
jgi:protoheme IX farnesyltransferase